MPRIVIRVGAVGILLFGFWLIDHVTLETLMMVLGMLPLIGMARGKRAATPPDDWQPPFTVDEEEQGSGPPPLPIPWSSYITFVPCLLAEFFPALIHATVYQHAITFGKTWFVGDTALLGNVSQMIDENLSLNSLFVLGLTVLVLVAPVLISLQLIRLGVMEHGFSVLRDRSVAWVKLGMPLVLYVVALLIEGWTIYLRLQPREVIWKGRTAIPDDPGTLVAVALITFIGTTLIGYWTATKIVKFQGEYGRDA